METIKKSLKKGAMQTGFAGISANGTTFSSATVLAIVRCIQSQKSVVIKSECNDTC